MTPLQTVLTVAYLGGIGLLLIVGYRLVVRFARPKEASEPETQESKQGANRSLVPNTDEAHAFTLGWRLGFLQVMVDTGVDVTQKQNYEAIFNEALEDIEHWDLPHAVRRKPIGNIIACGHDRFDAENPIWKILYCMGLSLSDYIHPHRPLADPQEIDIQKVGLMGVGLDGGLLDSLLAAFHDSPPPSERFGDVLYATASNITSMLNGLNKESVSGVSGTTAIEIKSDFCVKLLRAANFTLEALNDNEILSTSQNAGEHECTLMVVRDRGVAESLEDPRVDKALLTIPETNDRRPLVILLMEGEVVELDVFDCDQSQAIFDSI